MEHKKSELAYEFIFLIFHFVHSACQWWDLLKTFPGIFLHFFLSFLACVLVHEVCLHLREGCMYITQTDSVFISFPWSLSLVIVFSCSREKGVLIAYIKKWAFPCVFLHLFAHDLCFSINTWGFIMLTQVWIGRRINFEE